MNNFSQVFEKMASLWRALSSRSSLVVGIILLLVAGFFTYRNFTRTSPPVEELEFESVKENGTVTGNIAGGATGPEVKQQIFGQGTVAGERTEVRPTSSGEKWVARAIGKDSLKESSRYTVQKGDTLWEVAKGKYGSGFEWKKILEANKDKVGFLPNGTQARIEIGQELTLP